MSRRGQGQRAAAPPVLTVLPVHRYAFIQHLMTRQVLSDSAVKAAFLQLTGISGDGADQSLWDMIADQNKEMSSIHLEIKRMKYLADGNIYYALVNTISDAPAKFGTHLTHHQREFFKQVLEAIALDDSAEEGIGALSEMQLLNMQLRAPEIPAAAADGTQLTAGKPLTKQDRIDTLGLLVSQQWLAYSVDKPHHYCIGVRSFLELSEMLLAYDVPDCTRKAWLDVM